MVERRAHEAAAVVDARDDVAGAIADRRDLVSAPIGMADRGEPRGHPLLLPVIAAAEHPQEGGPGERRGPASRDC